MTTGARSRLLRSVRTSRAATLARGARTRAKHIVDRLAGPEHALARVRERAALAVRAAPRRRHATAAYATLTTEVDNLPGVVADDASAPTISLVLLVDDTSPGAPIDIGIGSGAIEIIAVVRGAGRAPASATMVVPARAGASLADAAAQGAQHARGDRICFVLASSAPLKSQLLARLSRALDTNHVAAGPQVVHPVRSLSHATPYDGLVRARGVELGVEHDSPVLRAVDAGRVADVSGAPRPVAGVTAACLLVDRAAYRAVGGLPDYADIDVAVFELTRRLRSRGGTVAMVPDAVVVDNRPVPTIERLTGPVAPAALAWRALIDDAGPALLREAASIPEAQLRIAITIAAPTRKVAPRWGDTHFAESFADSLRRAGHLVRVQTADAADDAAGRACDVHCVVRGLVPVRRTRGQHHVLWIISHPETIDDSELEAADLVLVASSRFADALKSRTATPVEVFLQATDTTRFFPLPPDPAYQHDITVVARSRDQYRSAVADAIASGLRPAIYGSGWERFVDPALIVSDHVDNTELARVYSSAGVVLNDHWDTMREWGFVSNRIFDALACGAPVISDDVAEVSVLFEGTVPSFRDAPELRRLVEVALADRDAARAEARRGMEIVVAHHTFDRRAQEFLDALARYGLDLPLSGTEPAPPTGT